MSARVQHKGARTRDLQDDKSEKLNGQELSEIWAKQDNESYVMNVSARIWGMRAGPVSRYESERKNDEISEIENRNKVLEQCLQHITLNLYHFPCLCDFETEMAEKRGNRVQRGLALIAENKVFGTQLMTRPSPKWSKCSMLFLATPFKCMCVCVCRVA